MREQQTVIPIEADRLVAKAKEMLDSGHRLVQIGCTKLESNELTYAFDKGYKFIYFKLIVPAENPEVPSISQVFWSAFLYENEIHDLYGIKFPNLAVDFQGNFYRTSQDKAFAFCERVASAVKSPAPEAKKIDTTTGTSS